MGYGNEMQINLPVLLGALSVALLAALLEGGKLELSRQYLPD